MSQEVQRGVAASSGKLSKNALVGSLVAVRVLGYDDEHMSRYGVGHKTELDLLVVDGEMAGLLEEQWTTYGELARQLGEQTPNVWIGCRVTSGPGSAPGSRWFGADFEIGDDEFEQVEAAVRALGNGTAPADGKKDKPKKDKGKKKDATAGPQDRSKLAF